jgi:hypothetical protein
MMAVATKGRGGMICSTVLVLRLGITAVNTKGVIIKEKSTVMVDMYGPTKVNIPAIGKAIR